MAGKTFYFQYNCGYMDVRGHRKHMWAGAGGGILNRTSLTFRSRALSIPKILSESRRECAVAHVLSLLNTMYCAEEDCVFWPSSEDTGAEFC